MWGQLLCYPNLLFLSLPSSSPFLCTTQMVFLLKKCTNSIILWIFISYNQRNENKLPWYKEPRWLGLVVFFFLFFNTIFNYFTYLMFFSRNKTKPICPKIWKRDSFLTVSLAVCWEWCGHAWQSQWAADMGQAGNGKQLLGLHCL